MIDFLARLLGRKPSDPWRLGETTGLDVLMVHAALLATDWEVFLASDVDSERPLPLNEGTNPIPAGVVIAVVLYHGSEHRGQICTILGPLGHEPPDLTPSSPAYPDPANRRYIFDTIATEAQHLLNDNISIHRRQHGWAA